MVDVYIWLVLVTGIFFTSFGCLVYFSNTKLAENKLFALLAAAFAIWAYSWFFMLKSTTDTTGLLFARLLNLGATIIPIFYLHWIFLVLKLEGKKIRWVLISGYFLTFVFGLFSFTDFYIKGVGHPANFPSWPIAGPLYGLFVLSSYMLFVGYGVFLLFKHLKNASGENKFQILYIIIGSILGFGGGATNFPLMYGVDSILPFVGIFSTLFSPFILGYAALRYHLLSIKVLGTQIFAGVIILIFLINFLTAENTAQFFIAGFLLALSVIFSILQVRSVVNEIEARKEVEKLAQELEKTNARLTELDQLKSEFLSLASHQLRSPLAAIKGYASLILENSFGTPPPAIKEAVDKIFQSSKSLVNIVQDFLDVSRIEQGRMKYDFTEADIKGLIKTVIDELRPTVEQKGLYIKYEDDRHNSYITKADGGKIKQVIGNVIDNAIKYTREGGVTINLSKDKEKGLLGIKIKDTGVGIPKETIPLLFQKFSRDKKAKEVNVMGTGLGLYVAKEFVIAHQGNIVVDSDGPGKGSVFTITLPLDLQHEHAEEINSFAQAM